MGRGQEEPNERYRGAHVWYDADKKQNYTAYKLLIADVIDGRLTAVPRGVMAAGNVVQAARGGVDLPADDIARVAEPSGEVLQEDGRHRPTAAPAGSTSAMTS